jgi:uncharacterized protein YdeI (YjbR/CyaY-like superfamily)
MNTKDKRIDAYIEKSTDFAKPILKHLRKLVHDTCPDVEETIKWSFPHFDYNGAMFCSMAAFKQHCAFGFWLGSLLSDPENIISAQSNNAMGHLGQIRGIADLPPDKILIKYMEEAMKLNEQGVKLPKAKSTEKKDLIIPDYFTAAIRKNKKASTAFEKFSPSHKREYLEWITEAKTEITRNKRMETAFEWIAEGKGRNWKYERK